MRVVQNKRELNRRTNSKELYLIACGYEKCLPEHSYGLGARNYYTIHFIVDGLGYYYVNNNRYELHAGQCFLIPMNKITFYKADKVNPWTYAWFCFNGERADNLMKYCHFNEQSLVLDIKSPKKYARTILSMLKYESLTPANESYLQSKLYKLVAMLQEEANAIYSKVDANDNLYILQAIDYIKNNKFFNFSVEDLANELHISRTYLFELFKRHLNTSPQEFIISSKIMNARELLMETDMPITDIAYSCGYQNPFAFSRAFKKEMNCTPRDYRKKYRHSENDNGTSCDTADEIKN